MSPNYYEFRLFFDYRFKFINVIVQSENRTCKQERLSYVEQQAVCHVVNLYDLVGHKADARKDEAYCATVLNLLCGVHDL